MRVEFDTTVLWAAFHKPAGLSFSLLALAAQRAPVLDGFITDVIGAEFWWRATQQGVTGPGQPVPRTYSEQELEPFLETFEPLFEPATMERAPLGRMLGQYAGMVGLPLGEFLYAVTGVDRDALLTAASVAFPVTFESLAGYETQRSLTYCGGASPSWHAYAPLSPDAANTEIPCDAAFAYNPLSSLNSSGETDSSSAPKPKRWPRW